MSITPEGKKLYVANGRTNDVSVIDTGSMEKIIDIKVGQLPWGVFLLP